MVKSLPAKAGDAGEEGSVLRLGRSLGGANGNPLQYSCLEYLMYREAWQAIACGAAKSWTQLSVCTCTHTHTPQKIDLIFTLGLGEVIYVISDRNVFVFRAGPSHTC